MSSYSSAALFVMVLWPALARAQSEHLTQPGSITGQVLCADTQRPARLANVELIELPNPSQVSDRAKHKDFDTSAPVAQSAETGLDGTYTLANVKPGTYYIAVDIPGYLLPLGEFSLKQLAAPDATTKARIAASIHAVTVNPGQTIREDVVLHRGASLTGTVTYDDGSPAIGIGIQPLTKDKDGNWTAFPARYRSGFGFTSTDTNGRYRILGLPPGTYAIQANFSLMQHTMTSGPMPSNPKAIVTFDMASVVFSLPLYSGGALRKSDAKGLELKTGEAEDGADLVFPLAKLHKVSGEVLAKDGHIVNGGKVEVLYADDKTQLTEAPILYDGSGFHLDFVPEGNYILKVSGAKDVTKRPVANPSGYSPAFHEESRTIKSYGNSEQPLVVQGDLSQFTATVPEGSQLANGTQ